MFPKNVRLVAAAAYYFLSAILVTTDGAEDPPATVVDTAVGEYAILKCPIDFPHGVLIPHILQWRKDEELIFSTSDGVSTFNENYINRINLLPEQQAWEFGRGSINLTSIRETDQGWYECKVYFPNRTPSSKLNGTWIHLKVQGGNLLTVPPVNQTIMEGKPVKMNCAAKDENSKVVWYKDSVEVSTIADMRERIRLSAEGCLNIVPTTMKDSGYYYCEVSNQAGEKQAAGAYLNVQYKAKVIHSPKEIYLPYGRPATLECYFKSNPAVTKIRWEKDGFLYDAYNVPGVFARRNGTLYFTKVDETHSGQYTCTPYNELGTEGPSPRMTVVVQRPPIFTITPHVLYLRKLGESIMMACDAVDGEDTRRPSIRWFKRDGTLIQEDRVALSGGNLTITNIQETDRGVYQCIASNQAATISSESELMIENMSPKAPHNVTANSTRTSVTVKWAPGFIKPKLEYSVWYRSTDTTEWRTIRINSRDDTQTVIMNLSPNKEYEIMVLSQDQHGDGMFSKAIRVKTKGLNRDSEETDQEFRSPVGIYQQIGQPYDVYVQVVPGGYRVNWKPPKHGAQMLKHYTVVWYAESDEQVQGKAFTIDLTYTIKELEEDKAYIIQVLAMSTNDYESASAQYIFHAPLMQRKGAIFIGAASAVFVISLIIAIVWYIRIRQGKQLFK